VAFDSYVDFIIALQKWLARDGAGDPATNLIPDVITLFEDRANNEIRSDYAIIDTVLTANPSSATPQIIPLPTDYLETAVTWNNALNPPPSAYPPGPFLYAFELKSPVQQVRVSAFYTTGLPFSYAVVGRRIILGKVPDAAYAFPFSYYRKLDPLATGGTAQTGTNWMLQNFPSLYLFGSLALSAPLFGEDARIPTWEGIYQSYKARFTKADRDARFSGQPMAVRAV